MTAIAVEGRQTLRLCAESSPDDAIAVQCDTAEEQLWLGGQRLVPKLMSNDDKAELSTQPQEAILMIQGLDAVVCQRRNLVSEGLLLLTVL